MGTLIRPKQSVGVQYATALNKLYPNRTFDANIIHHNFYKRKAFISEQITFEGQKESKFKQSFLIFFFSF